jgi:hypothetical protein
MILNTVRQFGYVCGFLTKLLAIIVSLHSVTRQGAGMECGMCFELQIRAVGKHRPAICLHETPDSCML